MKADNRKKSTSSAARGSYLAQAGYQCVLLANALAYSIAVFSSTVPGIEKLHRNMFSSRLMNYFWQKMFVFCIGFYFLGLYCKTFYGGIGNDIQNISLLQKCLRMFHNLISLNQHSLSQALMYILITFCKLHSICEICNQLQCSCKNQNISI